DRELRRVRPVVVRIPFRWLSRFWCGALDVGSEIGIQIRIGHLKVAGQDVEDTGHVCSALNVRVAAQRVYAASCTPDVPKQQLYHRCGSNYLSAVGVLRPTDGIDDRSGLLHIAVFAN